MEIVIEIDHKSGFCFGVTRAINKAEDELGKDTDLYCLGDIVHNGRECDRLSSLGLKTINHENYHHLSHAKVLLRAHGEPPATYEHAKRNHINIVDATCPVVLHLQKRIKSEYDMDTEHQRQIVIFGKNGHAEVMGLVGQTEGTAIVIENEEDALKLDFSRDIRLYSQTTKSLSGFQRIVQLIKQHISPNASFVYHDTICRQVANRMEGIRDFASRHDAILFVSDKKSSNGGVLFSECLRANDRSYMVDRAEDIHKEWFYNCKSVGICGATSTPKWLMEHCKTYIEML